MRAAFVVPWRDKGDPARQMNLRYVLAYLDRLHIAPVLVSSDGRGGSEPFNRSAAYNRAVAILPDADVFCFHEADMVLPESQLRAGIFAAYDAPGLVVPFSEYHYLSRQSTKAVWSGVPPASPEPSRIMADGASVGAVNIVSRHTLSAAGRWDETFEGWGYDDRAMCLAFAVATGTLTRHIPGPGIHLWHRAGWKTGAGFAGGANHIDPAEAAATEANRRRYQQYQRARHPAQIRRLTAGLAHA